MVMIDPTLFQSEWFVNLGVDERYMYLYLLVNASNKTGVFEWNQRMINFCANTNRTFTKDDVLKTYGNRIQMVPGRSSTMIIVDYVRFNWCKDGRVLDPERNRLDRAIVKELNEYGLTVDKLNEMSRHKIAEAVQEEHAKPDPSPVKTMVVPSAMPETSVTKKDIEEMFNGFWSEYPSCSRKVDRKHCLAKFTKILNDSKDSVSTFNRIMTGLSKWKSSYDWNKNGGQFICAPLVWLNQERWDADVDGNPVEAKKPKVAVVVKESDWILCSERCANCNGHACSCGYGTPPQMWPRPTAPEECPKYRSL